MSWISQSFVFGGIAVLCALGTRFIAGEYNRSVPCDPATIEAYEVCMDTVKTDWKDNVVWIDARGRKAGKILIKGALEISETHLNEDLSKTAQRIFKSSNHGKKLVVLCETDACGSSQYVRGKILENMLHNQVYVLHGGWKAYEAGMKEY